MSISFDYAANQFHLTNGSFSYIIKILENGSIGQVYTGAALGAGRAYPLLDPIPFAGFSNRDDRAAVRFEYPAYGNGDFRRPAFAVRFADGSSVVEPRYEAHRIYAGKAETPGLPATYTEKDDEAETLELDLRDAASGLRIILFYTIFAQYNCLARHVRFINEGSGKIVLTHAMSLSLDLPDSRWNLITLTGSWAREFETGDAPLRTGFQGIQSSRGVSGAQTNPALILRRPAATEREGEVLGVSLLYSGNFTADVEVDQWGIARLRIGINPHTFSWELAGGAMFDTPEAVLAWSGTGLGNCSRQYHELYRNRLARGAWRDAERPVLLNNWEGTYFNFTEEKILEMAAAARDLGAELFVLDDGWFGKRDDDHSSLGDWVPHAGKLPGGVTGLAEKVCALGIKFGLWIEPEMVSPDSDLFRAHPDWAVHVPARPRTESRYQYALDMGRPEIIEYLFNVLSGVIKSAPVSYVKWDMNRYITEPYSITLPPERQGEFFHRYVLGLYDLYARLTRAFPEILFESCASGGSRFDPGLLGFAPQAWLSDDTDAVERLAIQEGASLIYPLSSMGAHVSAIPNHQTGRLTPLSFRAMVSFFGCLGYELDPAAFSGEEREAVKRQIAFYKAHRRTFQYGRFFRLLSPLSGRYASWMVVSEDKEEAIVGFYRILANPNQRPFRLKLAGLEGDADYRVTVWEEGGFSEDDRNRNCGERGGDELMQAGLFLESAHNNRPKKGDYFAELFLVEKTG
ncbi:alpha-galactosidase [Treponema primitia]|uniref:alpha-galactosidase n=1 Tax=Treponema primitia TaxID=88058 RepID=UPI00025552D7|nr:alpha-galactosidase [Treponema primitia]